jgi:CheY-like chemotaxis protein
MSSIPRRVLVVEDHLAMGGVIQFALRKAGLEVTLARHGRAAWELLKQQDFDLVVSDFQMPEINGGQLRELMCGDARLAGVPFVLVTAKGLELDEAYYRDQLFVHQIVNKPFSPRALMRLAHEIVSGETEPVAV